MNNSKRRLTGLDQPDESLTDVSRSEHLLNQHLTELQVIIISSDVRFEIKYVLCQ